LVSNVSQPYLYEWSVIVSLVLAAAAVLAIWYTSKTYRAAITERHEAQASLISVWPEKWNLDVEAPKELQMSRFDAVVCNGSKQPVYNVCIALLPPNWHDDEVPVVTRVVPVLSPNSESEFISMPPSSGYEDDTSVRPALEIGFTDNRGNRWLRRPDGDLVELKAPSALMQLLFRQSTDNR